MAWFTRLSGEISTACRLITPAEPIRVASSLGPLQHAMRQSAQGTDVLVQAHTREAREDCISAATADVRSIDDNWLRLAAGAVPGS